MTISKPPANKVSKRVMLGAPPCSAQMEEGISAGARASGGGATSALLVARWLARRASRRAEDIGIDVKSSLRADRTYRSELGVARSASRQQHWAAVSGGVRSPRAARGGWAAMGGSKKKGKKKKPAQNEQGRPRQGRCAERCTGGGCCRGARAGAGGSGRLRGA